MPWLWITSAVLALALAEPGRAQDAASPDSLASTPAPTDSLILSLPAAAPTDSLILSLPAAAPDSLALPPSQPETPALPVLVPVVPAGASPPAEAAPPVLQPVPRRIHYQAQRRGFFSTRSLWAAVSFAGSVVLYNQGTEYRDRADELYRRYERAADPTEIESLYQRTTNQDTKGQVCWALGAALAVNGVRLLLTRETEVTTVADHGHPALQMLLAPQSLYLRVHKWL